MTDLARHGWQSDFAEFTERPSYVIRQALHSFIQDASESQIRAWNESIPPLQREVREMLSSDTQARRSSAILEYELPMELRRPDVVFLVRGPVVVLELKGKSEPSQADLDQAAAYARDLRCYHSACADRPVIPILVPTRKKGYSGEKAGVHISGPDALDELILGLEAQHKLEPIPLEAFLAESAYRPLPTLVRAARELFEKGEVREIWRARAQTDPAVKQIADVIHHAARTKTRHLVLVTGVPGAGKTLVGLRTVHAHFLDDLAVPRVDGKPTVPAVFLSGNGPLVQVLQYELKAAGGGGKAFVRDVKGYVKRYSSGRHLVPPEHVLVFDEAQRAFDADQVEAKHKKTGGSGGGKSEPEHFIEFADRIPEWCVVVGLIGSGQEIHIGEEAGLGQWRRAVEQSARRRDWHVHLPANAVADFGHSSVPTAVEPSLSLDTELRFHLARDFHEFVADLLAAKDPSVLSPRAAVLEKEGFHLRLTRDLDAAKSYLRERYAENREARYGLLASSKDKALEGFGIPNGFQSTKRINFGPWYGDPEDHPDGRSCRQLEACVTEFGAQGLELDAVLLAWGTDLVLTEGRWSNARARGYKRGAKVRNPLQLRINAYRVLLTRGRDGCVVLVPRLQELDETYEYLQASGFSLLVQPSAPDPE